MKAISGLSLVSLLIGFAACDPGAGITAAPTSACIEAGAQCVLADGPLGVCERSQCSPGETPPCFQCVPQH